MASAFKETPSGQGRTTVPGRLVLRHRTGYSPCRLAQITEKTYPASFISSISCRKDSTMQPPPQAVPSGVAGPPPAGNPRSSFWANSPYRKPANNNAPVAPITRPLQPVTDPFAFNRQTLQNTPVGSSSKSSPPNLPGPALPVFFSVAWFACASHKCWG